MVKPTLLVLAAGMGSRYGSLKQMDGVGPNNEAIIDYSVYDAIRAGFGKVVFVIRHSFEKEFREVFSAERFGGRIAVEFVFQELDYLPQGAAVPEGRVKPWGTSHAILAARSVIDGPFAVINADDYYGPEAFRVIYDYLTAHPDKDGVYEYAMVGYKLENTVTENGHVARGVCETDADGYLASVTERTHIEKTAAGARYTEDGGATWHELPGSTIVSMNMWGFTHSFLPEAEARFAAFLDDALKTNPLKGEYFLPSVVSQLVGEGKARVKVLHSADKWYGVTNPEDKQDVVDAVARMAEAGLYPAPLWPEA